MAFQSTIASIQNIRKQKQLELELIELDRKWHVELKILARERLGLVKELCRLHRNQRELDHLQASLHGADLARYTDRAQGRLQHVKDDKKVHKYNFEPDPVEKMSLQLPPLIVARGDQTEEAAGRSGLKHGKQRRGTRLSGSLGFHGDGEDLGKVLTSMDLKKQRVQLMKSNYEHCTADRRNRRRPFWDKAVLGGKRRPDPRDRNGFYKALAFSGLRDSGSHGSAYASALMYSNSSPSEGSEQDDDGHPLPGAAAATEGEVCAPDPPKPSLKEEDPTGTEEVVEKPPEDLKTSPGQVDEAEEEVEEDYRLPRLTLASRSKSPSLPSFTQSPRRQDDASVGPRPAKAVHPSLSDRRSASLDYLPAIKGLNRVIQPRSSQRAAGKNSQPFITSWTLPTISET